MNTKLKNELKAGTGFMMDRTAPIKSAAQSLISTN